MCFCNCQWEQWSWAKEDCLCKKPKGLPCPHEVSDEEAERLNDEWEEPEPDDD